MILNSLLYFKNLNFYKNLFYFDMFLKKILEKVLFFFFKINNFFVFEKLLFNKILFLKNSVNYINFNFFNYQYFIFFLFLTFNLGLYYCLIF